MLIIGHRGIPSLVPENTILSFKRALELGADGIELDVHLTKDGVPVVIHDEKVDRTTNGQGYVKDLTFGEIRGLDAGSYFHRRYRGLKIPSLEEILEFIVEKEIYLNIEIKSGIIKYGNIEDKVIDLLDKYNLLERVVLSSFNHYSIVKCKKICSRVQTGVLYYAGLVAPWEYARSINADYLHPYHLGLDDYLINNAHQNRKKVFTFVVNDRSEAIKLKKMGVDGIFTDAPHEILKYDKGG